ncbi:hypothetical protein OUHCRE2_48200 [Enterobacter asburiae]
MKPTCRDSTDSYLFFKPLRYRLGRHLIATLVKRLWLSYTTGLHIPATRWIGILPKESPDRCGTCAICRTAYYHTGADNYQYPWCDLNVPLVTLVVKRRMYFLLPKGVKKMPEGYLALEMKNLNVLGYLNYFPNNSAITVYWDGFK